MPLRRLDAMRVHRTNESLGLGVVVLEAGGFAGLDETDFESYWQCVCGDLQKGHQLDVSLLRQRAGRHASLA